MTSPERAAASEECHRCHAGMRPEELRCRVCGTPRPGVDLPAIIPSASTADPQSNRGLMDNPYAVLAAVFLAMAILGLPLIWSCRAWSPVTKTLLTVITVLYTALVFWLFWLAMSWSWNRISPYV